MKIAILDDEKFFLEKFYNILKKHENFKTAEINLYQSGTELLEAFEKENHDIVFLDVEMPEISGIEVGEKIRRISDKTVIAFVSGYPQYALDAFDCEAVSYILKDEDEFFDEKLRKVYKKYVRHNSRIILETGKSTVSLFLKDIKYVEYFRKYCIYHTESGDYSVRQTLLNALSELNDLGFYQIYRCYIVNLKKIREIRKNEVVLTDNTKLTVSRGSYSDIVNAYATYMDGTL